MSDSKPHMQGQIYRASVFYQSIGAARTIGKPIFNIKAGTDGALRLREVIIGTALGSTTHGQATPIRFTRNATAYATEGGTRALTIEPMMPWRRAATATVRANVTEAAAATEGGKLLFADTMVAPTATGARWEWNSWTNAAASPWIDEGKQLAILVMATDTVIVNATVTFEEMNRKA